jgi:hypothetical protein
MKNREVIAVILEAERVLWCIGLAVVSGFLVAVLLGLLGLPEPDSVRHADVAEAKMLQN